MIHVLWANDSYYMSQYDWKYRFLWDFSMGTNTDENKTLVLAFWDLRKCRNFFIENWENWNFENITWKIRSNVVALLLTNKSLSSHLNFLKIFQKINRQPPKKSFSSTTSKDQHFYRLLSKHTLHIPATF